MQTRLLKLAGVVTVLIVLASINSFTENEPPVRIEFDSKSQRIELMTGKQVPEYKFAVRGSVRFFLERLDTPEDFVSYIRGAIQSRKFTTLKSMEKFQPSFDFWYFYFKSGAVHSGPVIQKAVSFIPLSLTDNKPENRVYFLLNDLQAIDWSTETQ